MLSGRRDYLAFHDTPLPKVCFDCGTEGATLLLFYTLFFLDISRTTQKVIALAPQNITLDKRTRDRGSGS